MCILSHSRGQHFISIELNILFGKGERWTEREKGGGDEMGWGEGGEEPERSE